MIEGFLPIELIEAVTKAHPSYVWIADKLRSLKNPTWESKAYVHYIDSKSVNWKHGFCLDFQDPKYGMVVIDVMKSGEIGGIEFVDNIEYWK